MQLTAQQALSCSRQQAWDALNDTELLQQAIPGCESLSPNGENQYAVLVTAAIGPVKAKFKGKLQLENLQAPEAYTIRFEGQGGPAGFGKGSADIRLQEVSPRETVLHYSAQATVGGKIAQVGSRLVDMAAQKMAADFFERFNAALVQRYPPPPEAPPPPPPPAGPVARLLAWIKRVLGG